MNFAFLISFLAGISTVLGSLILFFKKSNKNSIIGKSLSLASGVMISVSLFDLIPSSVLGLNQTFYIFPAVLISFVFVIFGIILSHSIDKYIPSYNNSLSGKLYKTGIFSMIAIMLHNIPEGIATYLTTTTDVTLGVRLAIAIALHNIPEGISISVPIYFSIGSKKRAILYTFVSGISEFIGSLIASVLFTNINISLFLNPLYSIIAGIMLSLSFDQLIPNALAYSSMKLVILFITMGFFIMSLIHFIF